MYSIKPFERISIKEKIEEENRYCSVKSLTLYELCVKKIFASFQFDPLKNKIEFKAEMELLKENFSKQPQGLVLSRDNFYEMIQNKRDNPEKIQLKTNTFFRNVKQCKLVCNFDLVDLFATNCNPRVLTEWLSTNCRNLTEISLAKCKFSKKMFKVAMESYGPQLKALELNYKHICNMDDNCINSIGKNCVNLIKLTLWNCKVMTNKDLSNFDKIFLKTFSYKHAYKVGYPFTKTIKLLAFPNMIKYDQEIFEFMHNVFYYYAVNLELIDLVFDESSRAYMQTIIANKNKTLKLKKFEEISVNEYVTFKEANRVALFLPCLEEVQLYLWYMTNHQKKTIIDNLNKNLLELRIGINVPISVLLYCGKRFKNLQTLHAGLVNNLNFRMCREAMEYGDFECFKRLLDLPLPRVFRNLRELRLNCIGDFKKIPVVETILVILKGCKHNLKTFSLSMYDLPDVDQIVDFICEKKMNLVTVELSYLPFITDDHVMRIAKLIDSSLEVGTEGYFNVKKCKKVTEEGANKVGDFVEQNQTGKGFVFEYKLT